MNRVNDKLCFLRVIHSTKNKMTGLFFLHYYIWTALHYLSHHTIFHTHPNMRKKIIIWIILIIISEWLVLKKKKQGIIINNE